MLVSMIAAAAATKWLVAAKVATEVGPVFIATQRVIDERKREAY